MQLEIKFSIDDDWCRDVEGGIHWGTVANYLRVLSNHIADRRLLKDPNGNTIGTVCVTETALERLRRKGVSIS